MIMNLTIAILLAIVAGVILYHTWTDRLEFLALHRRLDSIVHNLMEHVLQDKTDMEVNDITHEL